MTKKKLKRRKHDSFLKYIYSVPKNTRTLLQLAQRRTPALRKTLSDVNLKTLEPIPGSFNTVGERGEAIIIYNGKTDWDPIADFKKKGYALFNGNTLPFECVMVNLANILDSDCRNSDNPSAAIGTLVMKHAYDPDGLRKAGEIIKELLNKLDNNTRSTLVKKIELYFQKPLRLSNEKASFPAAFGLKGF